MDSRRISAAAVSLLALTACGGRGAAAREPEPPALVSVRRAERAIGYRSTENFGGDHPGKTFGVCYYVEPLRLPADYSGLRSKRVDEGECRVDRRKFDVFHYRPEALAGVGAPVTAALRSAEPARQAFVAAHEDYHEQPGVRERSPALKEAASTLMGFATAAEAGQADPGEADLYLEKARLVNEFHERLSALYAARAAGRVSRADALAKKADEFAGLKRRCSSVAPGSKTFNPCPAVFNNAGLALDATYTRLYPDLYVLYAALDRDPRRLLRSLAAIYAALDRTGGDEAAAVRDELRRVREPERGGAAANAIAP